MFWLLDSVVVVSSAVDCADCVVVSVWFSVESDESLTGAALIFENNEIDTMKQTQINHSLLNFILNIEFVFTIYSQKSQLLCSMSNFEWTKQRLIRSLYSVRCYTSYNELIKWDRSRISLGLFVNLSQIYDNQSCPLKSRFAGVFFYTFSREFEFDVTTSKRQQIQPMCWRRFEKNTQQN